jgi:Family of unknown function (DUF6270)
MANSSARSHLRVFVVGSCVSRDAFGDTGTGDDLVLGAYLARSSLATLSCPAASPPPNVAKIASLFQRRMVLADHSRLLLALARAGDFDLLLLDLIDERFHLHKRADGAIVTYSNEYSSIASRPLDGTLIRSGSAEHVRLWRAGLHQFVEALRESGGLAKVRVNCVYWASKDVDGQPTPGFAPDATEAANAFLADRYRDLQAAFGESACLRYPASILVSDPRHRWGVSAFHYVPAMYEETRRLLIASASRPAEAQSPPCARRADLADSDEGLTASLTGDGSPALEYAFYLMRDQQRVAATWYSPRTTVTLPYPTAPGDYQVIVFERQRQSAKPPRKYRSATLRLPDPARYSTERWGSPVEFYGRDQPLRPFDGVHRMVDDGPSSLDVLLRGFAGAAVGKPLLVCFGGAIVDRGRLTAPFFHGLSLGRACQLPVVCVADPTITRSSRVSLGWYAGNDQWPALYLEIARRLDELAMATGSPLILVGGSGGGFAALAVQFALRSASRAVVWNPQTSISRYHAPSVQRYLLCAFPEIARKLALGRSPTARATREGLEECMERAGLLHDLTRVMAISRAPALYLQNESDVHHIEHHLTPLLAARGLRLEDGQRVVSLQGLTVCLGHWGAGHARPSPEAVAWLVRHVAAGLSDRAIAERILAGEMPVENREQTEA